MHFLATLLTALSLTSLTQALPATDAASKKPCSPAVDSLATGIHLNIVGQHGTYPSISLFSITN